MASEKFGPHLPTILEAKHIEALYELWGVDYAVEIKLPDDDETPETVRPGYCGAYTSHFEDGGLSFPLPRFLLEALAELGIAFSQMASNFFRYFLASWIRAREEGLKFGLEELRQLFAIKRNSGFPGTMILTPRPGRSIIDGIPNMDDRWREKFLFFKINPASVCDFDFGRVTREWSDEIEPFGPAPMKPELRGLIATLRRGSPRWLAFTVDRIRAAYALPPDGNRATPIGPAAPVRPGKGRQLGIAFSQMASNFFRYFLASWIRAREEGLKFGLEELRQLFAIKRNSGFPGTMILTPRPGRSIIDGIPNMDDRWREKFLFFKINPASVCDFDFGRVTREWSDEIEPFGPAPMKPELRGLIATLRRGSPRWLAFTVDRIRAAYALPPDGNRATPIGPAAPVRPGKGRRNKRKLIFLLFPFFGKIQIRLFARPSIPQICFVQGRGRRRRYPIVLKSPPKPVSIAVPVGGARRAPNTSAGSVGDRALDDDVDSSTHRRRRRALEEINSVSSNSPRSGLPPPLRASGEGTSKVDQSAHLPDVHETSSWRFLYDNEVPILGNPESLALIWRKIKEKGCELPSLGDMRERDAYVWMAVANAKAMEASNEYTTFMERRLADFPRKEEVEGHLLTIQQLRGELEAIRVTEKQCGVEVEGLKGKLSATETEKVAIQNDLDSMKEKHRREIKGRDAAAR
ncbi:hypothetical protein DY000_02040044 [Brassica cretica]|uniref:Aminotransferase-like plant mobile domain-containing protein n=1 Tax=Brassica cretica TaxID=69181 RepID=A0ABQ7BPK2_BRACR|nr:hypothetical protein DY000_02040044 [Brassica cretica]